MVPRRRHRVRLQVRVASRPAKPPPGPRPAFAQLAGLLVLTVAERAALAILQDRAAAGLLPTSPATLAAILGATEAAAGSTLRKLHAKGWARTDREGKRFLPTLLSWLGRHLGDVADVLQAHADGKHDRAASLAADLWAMLPQAVTDEVDQRWPPWARQGRPAQPIVPQDG